MKKVELIFESFLWKSRLFIVLAVVSSLIGSFSLFIAGLVEVISPLVEFFKTHNIEFLSKKLIASAIASIDMFLIATFLFIFSLGLYELFISKIDVAEKDPKSSKVLFITNLD
ncbi:MAG TPA: YqhA family protein, partial [Aquificaceae bacterium]|nr:YqhA family protein [Aquificaceae bacterium]